MIQADTFFWLLMTLGSTLAAIAIAYQLGHTVGYHRAAKLTLPRFEITNDAAAIEETIVDVPKEKSTRNSG